MSNKIISIIIATYNAAYTIERCLCSIISQKTDDIELIIIDGASKDQTIAIIEQYKDSIDVFFSEPDQGIYDAWNKGIKASNGEWIMFVGADDQLISGALSSYLSFLSDCSKENADIVTAKAVVIDDKGKEIYKIESPYCWERFRKVFNISHGSTLHNKRLFEEVGLFDISFKICADYELLLRKKLNSIFLDKFVFIMQDGGLSTTNQSLEETYRAKRMHNSQSFIGSNYRRYRGYVGNAMRRVFPILKKLK